MQLQATFKRRVLNKINMSPMPAVRRHLVQFGEHMKRDLGKLGQRSEKYGTYGKALKIMSSWETWWQKGTGSMIRVFKYLWRRDLVYLMKLGGDNLNQ